MLKQTAAQVGGMGGDMGHLLIFTPEHEIQVSVKESAEPAQQPVSVRSKAIRVMIMGSTHEFTMLTLLHNKYYYVMIYMNHLRLMTLCSPGRISRPSANSAPGLVDDERGQHRFETMHVIT